jgi:integrase
MMKSSNETDKKWNRLMRTKIVGVYERQPELVGQDDEGNPVYTRMFKDKPDICFYISYKDRGKKVWEKVGFISEGYTPKLAADVRAERLRSMRHEEELPRQKKKIPYFRDVTEKYLKWAEGNKADKGEHDKGRYHNHLADRIGNKRLDEISAFDLEKIKSELLKSELSPATVKHCLVLVRQVYNKAIAWGMYKGTNPIKGVKLPALQNSRERFLSYHEADTLLRALRERSDVVHDMALLSLHSGLRAGEIFNLKAHDIDLQHSLISIMDPKNKTPRKAHMTTAVKEMLAMRVKDLDPDSLVFQTSKGTAYGEITDVFKTVVDTLFNKGVKDRRQRVTFHTMRHTFGSWLALQGESLVTIRELLGHKSFAMTQRYAHLSDDELDQGYAEIFDE